MGIEGRTNQSGFPLIDSCRVYCCLDRDSTVVSYPRRHETALMEGGSEGDDVMCVQTESRPQRRRRGKSRDRMCLSSVGLSLTAISSRSRERFGLVWGRARRLRVFSCGVVGASDEKQC
ncbi:hypothetical protein BLNAU_10700 [Blattamonas nauphoetae]|uniref:Uncharacterized protein n=1 Tax=Blattamonas nauphoetae TaxID=2049346 RepID=A0ABQ9XPP4_9EUKA|nr:hypothetical protein BLNAU_10700 [Blattamonas nauphoetae]